MAKLTDAQLVILSTAAQRNNGCALPAPKSLKAKGAALTKILDALRKKGLLVEQPAPPDGPAWREAEDGRRMTLVISEAGLQAIDGETSNASEQGSNEGRTRAKEAVARPRAASRKGKDAKSAVGPREGSKLALVIGLLERKSGATVDEMVEATGWQAHSVRGAISGALKKKLGLDVTSEKVEGRGRVYRIDR